MPPHDVVSAGYTVKSMTSNLTQRVDAVGEGQQGLVDVSTVSELLAPVVGL